jgi:hypothetical protein
MNPGTCPMRGRVDEHFARKLRPGNEHALREHLPGCTSCKSLYDRHLLLLRLDPKAAGDAQARLGQGLGLVKPPVPVTQGVAVLAVAALLAVGVVVTRPSPFAAGAENLRVYRVRPGVEAEPVKSELRAGDELAFAYENPHGRKWLMIYGVDEHGHVYWFHPSWSDPDADPAAVQAFGGTALHELPEAISHDFDGQRLVLHEVLSDERLTVKQAEALMRGHDAEQPLSLQGAEQTAFTVKVKR